MTDVIYVFLPMGSGVVIGPTAGIEMLLLQLNVVTAIH